MYPWDSMIVGLTTGEIPVDLNDDQQLRLDNITASLDFKVISWIEAIRELLALIDEQPQAQRPAFIAALRAADTTGMAALAAYRYDVREREGWFDGL